MSGIWDDSLCIPTMPPRGNIWAFFETQTGDNGKTVKYLDNKTHICAWCTGCLDRFVSTVQADEAVRVNDGELEEVRSGQEIRDTGMSWESSCQ